MQMSKNFRSSKNLKQLGMLASNESKDESAQLRMKIKALEEQVQLLKKTNLNIFIPLSQKQPLKEKENKDETIRKLRIQLLKQQQDSQTLRTAVKRLQKQKQVMKFTFQNELKQVKSKLEEQRQKVRQLQQENQQLQEQYQEQKEKRSQIQKQLIELKVQVRFLKEDLQMYKTRYEEATKNLNQLKGLVMQVEFNSNIYKADKQKITAISSVELAQMRDCIFELQKQIQELLWKLANPKPEQKEKVVLSLQTKNVAEQIVRLKKNIDMQLGFKGDDSVIKSFLDKYSQTNTKFKELIDGCKAPQKLIDAVQES